MKAFGFGLLLFIWLILTVLLCLSFIGWFILAPDINNFNEKSTWMKMGSRLIELIQES